MPTTVIENAGEYPAFPAWVVYGPCTSFSATAESGETFSWKGTLPAGQGLAFDCETSRVVDTTGANRYHEIGPAPRFWSIPPGVSTISWSITGTTAASSVSVTWAPRKALSNVA